MEYLNVKPAHIVGHSQGGVIALQLVIDYPDYVHSLSLLEPALVEFIPSVQKIKEQFRSIIQMYEQGQGIEEEGKDKKDEEDDDASYSSAKSNAIDSIMKIIAGKDYLDTIEKVLPGCFNQAVVDAYALFNMDMPAIRSWDFSLNSLIKQLIARKYQFYQF
jgi:pimeloyl-ACP methyl ester carboxylesterase